LKNKNLKKKVKNLNFKEMCIFKNKEYNYFNFSI